jgi:hypothetical protein
MRAWVGRRTGLTKPNSFEQLPDFIGEAGPGRPDQKLKL